MKRIPLSKGKFALVDDQDYDFLMQWKWCVSSHGYATRLQYLPRPDGKKGKSRTTYMRRVILGLTDGNRKADHINRNPLDNRRENLRECSHQQNCWNKTRARTASYPKTSKFHGVCWSKQTGKWRARINVGGKERHLGFFVDESLAAAVYAEAAAVEFGEFAPNNNKNKEVT